MGQATVGACRTTLTPPILPNFLTRPSSRGAPDIRLDVVAIGNALVDVLASATDEEVAALDLVKGTMALVDLARSESIYATMGSTTRPRGARRPTPRPA